MNLSYPNALYFVNKGAVYDCRNYRPIFPLSNINKIIEKLMHERLYSFFCTYKCIYIDQLGFRKKPSKNAPISITNYKRRVLDNNNIACGILMDHRNAFDTVDHEIQLKN